MQSVRVNCALRRVLLELDVHAVGVLAPALPGLVAAEFFGRHRQSVLRQPPAQRIHVFHFETEMMNPLALDFRRGIGAENFDELSGRGQQIKPEQPSVFVEIKMPPQTQRAAIEIPAAFKDVRKNAEMGDGFDHAFKL